MDQAFVDRKLNGLLGEFNELEEFLLKNWPSPSTGKISVRGEAFWRCSESFFTCELSDDEKSIYMEYEATTTRGRAIPRGLETLKQRVGLGWMTEFLHRWRKLRAKMEKKVHKLNRETQRALAKV